jgi:signal transduction histidine kinase
MSLSALGRAELTEKERTTLRNTSQVIDEAIRSLREISNNLSPHVLNNFGLARGIKNFVDRLSAMH